MNKCFFKLGERFQYKWLFIRGFWRILYFALIAKFGYVSTNVNEVNGYRISVGTITPLEEYASYKHKLAGWVFYEPVLLYY